MSELVGKLSQGVEYYKGDPGPKGDTGPRGEKGEPFRFEDFTPEQLESLKVKGDTGPAGEPGVKGDKGDAFTYADFTQEQLEALKGQQGQAGRDGKDGVSITHTWNGTSLSITSASGTSEMDLKGEKGDQGQIGPQGPQGPAGSDYVLTQDDKQEIAGLVDLSGYQEKLTAGENITIEGNEIYINKNALYTAYATTAAYTLAKVLNIWEDKILYALNTDKIASKRGKTYYIAGRPITMLETKNENNLSYYQSCV